MAAPTTTTTAVLKDELFLACIVGTPCIVTIGQEDLLIAHTGLQATDTTTPAAAASGDALIVTDANDPAPTADLAPGSAAGSTARKAYIPAGGAATVRGYEKQLSSAGVRQIAINAIGHSAFVQVIKGNLFGSMK